MTRRPLHEDALASRRVRVEDALPIDESPVGRGNRGFPHVNGRTKRREL
jgi:hypothetical protein